MIKLLDILNETITNPLTFDADQNNQILDEIIEAAKGMGEQNPVLWRGSTAKSMISHVTGNRTGFRGANLGAQTIMKELNIQYPIFCYFERSLVLFFGSPLIIVMKQPYKMYQSPEVDDVMSYAQRIIYKTEGGLRTQIGTRSDEEIIAKAKEGAKTYQQIDSKPLVKDREVIIDAPEYWMLSPTGIRNNGGKFMPPNAADVQTYGDLVKILTIYKKFLYYRLKRR